MSYPCSIIFFTIPSDISSTPIIFKNNTIFLFFTISFSKSSKIISIKLSLHLYETFGIFPSSENDLISNICGITSPLRIIDNFEPTFILLFFIYAPLNPFKNDIFTFPIVNCSISILGFKYPSLLGVQITSFTIASFI